MLDNEVAQDLSKLALKDILQSQDLVLEEILAIKDIHSKIKLNMKTFVDYCRRKPEFTIRLINMGLKCPTHQSSNLQTKNYTYIAADILTCDHETLADLFILPSKKSSQCQEELLNDDEIEEQIETEEVQPDLVTEQEKYIFLSKILEYIDEQELDENCLNYIAKALSTLVRKKISEFLQFFISNPKYLEKLISISHYPAIAHLLAKMLTDDDDNLTDNALNIKKKIIPSLLQKLHTDIHRQQTLEILEGMQDIINSSRYGDSEERSELQRMSDIMVSDEQIRFFVEAVLESLEAGQKKERDLYTLVNATTYLTHLVNRLNMDEQNEFMFGGQPVQQFRPTLQYKIDRLFLSFCRFLSCFDKIWDFREIAGKMFGFIPTRVLQPLVLMTKHSQFGTFYSQIKKEERSTALQSLLKMTCATNISGILLQNAISLLEKMLVQQQLMASNKTEIVCPDDLYLSIQKYSGAIATCIAMVLEQNRIQRNKNQNGIYFRKVLLLLDNYFKHPDVLKLYPTTAKIQELFPSFNTHNCRLYAEKAIVLDHPGGSKVQKVEEFQFLYKNQHLIRSSSPQLEEDIPQKKEQPLREEVTEQKSQNKPKEIMFKLDGKLKALKDRVKQKNTDKDSTSNQLPVKVEQAIVEQSPQKNKQNTKAKGQDSKTKGQDNKEDSPSKSKQQAGLTFFVRHLMIY